jgi:hypothetical protein
MPRFPFPKGRQGNRFAHLALQKLQSNVSVLRLSYLPEGFILLYFVIDDS